MKVKHSLEFETEFDLNNESVIQLINTYSETQIKEMLESMLKDILVPRLRPILEEVNGGGTWAILKVVE